MATLISVQGIISLQSEKLNLVHSNNAFDLKDGNAGSAQISSVAGIKMCLIYVATIVKYQIQS